MAETQSLFKKLTDLFRSGPTIRKRIKNNKKSDSKSPSSLDLFKKNHSDVYNSTISAYGSYDRMARYSDFSEMESCVSGDTLIATPNGFVEIQELAKKYSVDESFIVYSYDHEKKQIVPALGKQARKTTTDHAWKITFDSGKTLIATADHRLMMRDGTYIEVQDLKSGMSMMPFYRKNFFNQDDGYNWIYTMNYADSTLKNGWIAEHRLIASWASQRKLSQNEVIHHINFVKSDNRPENLQIMTEEEHKKYHAEILNGKKWDYATNSEWIENFKKKHSEFMKQNNPAKRHDITYGLILNLCDLYGFNLYDLCRRLDCDTAVIYRRIKEKGFNSFETFAKAYNQEWKNNSQDNAGNKNPRYDKSLTFQNICDKFKDGMTIKELTSTLNKSKYKIINRLKENGFNTFQEFSKNFSNHKVEKIEYHGIIDLYDLTVDGYKNYATDSIIIHNTPELSSALDIYAEETVSADSSGKVLHIYSENRKIKQLLENLFYDVLNVEFNLVMWVRNLCKYGDFFLFNDVSPDFGVINVFPIPISEVEREEGFDPEDPSAVRFRWITQGNRILENWQISHFRLLGNDAFLPYGSSVLEGARRIWRQLILIEDAMLVYRVIRAPERRVFYIDVGNIPPENIGDYLQQAQTSLKRNTVVDKTSGKVDLRYNPLSVDEDYFLPVRGGDTGTRIDTLAGGQNTSAIEDVEYIQKKLFAALKIPKAYLGYDEEIGSKSTLAQEDIRFSRTIQRIQKTVLAELNKLAMIHLYAHGYGEEDLLDFEIKLSNPSSIAQQQKLELIRTKFDIASAVPEGLVDKEWIRKNIMEFNDDEISRIEKGKIRDKLADLKLEAVALPTADGGAEGEGEGGGEEGGDMFGGGGEEAGGVGGGEAAGGGGGGLADLFAGDVKLGSMLAEDDDDDAQNVEDDDETDHLLFDEDLKEEESYQKIKPKASQQYRNKKLKHGAGSVIGPDTSLTGDTSYKFDSSADLLNRGDKSRGIFGGVEVSADDLGMGRKSSNPLKSSHERNGDPQMKKIFDSMNRNFGSKITNSKNRSSKLLNEDTEMIIIDNEDYGDE